MRLGPAAERCSRPLLVSALPCLAPPACGRAVTASRSSGRWGHQTSDSCGQLLYLWCIARPVGVAVQLGAQLRECGLPVGTRRFLRAGESLADRRDPAGRQAVRAGQLVRVRACQREAGRPDVLRLALDVELREVDRPRGVDLVLRDEATGGELEDVEAARDL